MTISIEFRQLYPWAVLPGALEADRAAARSESALYREGFRYVRKERRAEHCAPWVMGHELGWRIASPIDILLTPLDQIELDGSADPDAAANAVNRAELWKRERSHLAVDKTSWLHLYQFAAGQRWENMFLPNGEGTVEWRLGWAADIPRGYFLMTLPSGDHASLQVPVGVLSSTVVGRMNEGQGFSIAARPTAPVRIRRGEEIARVVLLHADSLRATAAYVAADPAVSADA